MQHFTLHLTSVGRGKLADSANAGVNNVQLRRIALGSGSGPGTAADADARTDLRTQEDIQGVAGSAQPDSGRIGVTAVFPALQAGDADVDVREMGIFARVGDGGAEFLLSYGALPAGDLPLTTLTESGRTVMAGIMDISSAAADVAITVDADITFEGIDPATNDETAAGLRSDSAVTPASFAFGLQAAARKATHARRGTMFTATTQAHATDADNVDRAITPKALNAVLSLITVLHFIAADPNYAWNLPFSRALVVVKGGDGGGGAARFSGHSTDGGDGGNSRVAAPGNSSITAEGGAGGLEGADTPNGISDAADLQFAGGGSGGRDISSPRIGGFAGAVGETVVGVLTDLTPASRLNIAVGAGGAAAASGPASPGDTAPGAGDDGWVRIVPLPSDS